MKKYILISLVLLYVTYTQAQQLPNRYISEITTNLDITRDVVFSENIPTVRTRNFFGNQIADEDSYGEITTTLRMNIYKPSNDSFGKKPVVIFAFGGGFVNGSRTERSMVLLCESFARRGFVTATIDYRLGLNINDEELGKRAAYRGLQDGRSAVRFFRKNASEYGIDPDQIFVSGHSAGGFVAYLGAYLDKDSERPGSTRNYFGRADLGGLDEIGNNQQYTDGATVSGKPNGVIGFAGAIADLTNIEGSSDVPGVYFHSSDDGTVPYNTGEPFSAINWLPGVNIPIVFGGNLMNTRANNVNAPHTFYSYNNRNHGVHFNGSTLYSDITPRSTQFLYDQKLKPDTTTISGDVDACTDCTSQTYTASNDQAFYYDWQITGGIFINRDSSSNIVTVKWDNNVTDKKLTVTPYSEQLARGILSTFELDNNDPDPDPDPDPDTCESLNFNDSTIFSFSNQDNAGNFSVVNEGAGLSLQNNTWKYITYLYTITPSTVIEFDFSSTSQGEIHGIGFENDNRLTASRYFKVHGTQNYGVTNYDNYNNGTTRYVIPVGSFYTGSVDRLVFINDNDRRGGNNSTFSNVKIYEGSCGRSNDVASNFTRTQPIYGNEDENLAPNLSVTPNPSSGNFNIIIDSTKKQKITASIYSVLGQKVSEVELKSGVNSYSASDLSLTSGIYLIKVMDSGNELGTKKLVIQ